MRDIECILRFFVMKSDIVLKNESKQISLKKSLNEFMGENGCADEHIIDRFRNEFINTMSVIYDVIGENAFKNYVKGKFTKKFHPAIFDAISVAVFQDITEKCENKTISNEKHIELLNNEEFKNDISLRTTDIANIKRRIELAKEYLIQEK